MSEKMYLTEQERDGISKSLISITHLIYYASLTEKWLPIVFDKSIFSSEKIFQIANDRDYFRRLIMAINDSLKSFFDSNLNKNFVNQFLKSEFYAGLMNLVASFESSYVQKLA